MDLISFCPSLPQILSYVDPDDVIRCLQLNKRINSVVTNNWSRMRKQCVKISLQRVNISESIVVSMEHFSDHWSSANKYDMLSITKTSVAEFSISSPLLLNKLPMSATSTDKDTTISDNSIMLRQFLTFILPRIELKTLDVDLELTSSETDAVFESIRDFYTGSISEIDSCDDFAVPSKLFELSQYRPMRYVNLDEVDNSWLGKALHEETIKADKPTRMKSEQILDPQHIFLIIKMWREEKVKTRYLCIESTNKYITPASIWQRILQNYFYIEKNTYTDFYVLRTSDDKKLHVKLIGKSIELVEM